MHHIDVNKIHREKTTWKLHKNAVCYIERILEIAPHKTAAVQPLGSHLRNHSSKTNKTRGALLKKQGRTHKRRSFIDPCIWMCDQCRLACTRSVRTQDTATKNCLERCMRERERERERESQETSCYLRDFMMMMMIIERDR